MAKKRSVISFEINYDDVFSPKGLLKVVYEFLVAEKLIDSDSEKDMEKLYVQSESQLSGREIWIWWRLTKDISAIVKGFLNIDFHAEKLKDVEVVYQDQKIKANKGEITVFVDASTKTDPEDKWAKGIVTARLKNVFQKRIYKKELSQAGDEFNALAVRLQDTIKQYLELKGFASSFEQFHPTKFYT